jgi:hypothetical protein
MREGGRIINVGSISSNFVPFNGPSVYAMTKGAVASLTRGLARELGPCGGHHRICSKSYSKDSGMIPRLDVAVERRASGARFDGPPWWATCPLNK